MMKKTREFANFAEYEKWINQFENCADFQEIPCLIDDGWKISADMFTECKSWKTALNRFEKAFSNANSELSPWIETIKEGCENGIFENTTGWMPAWTTDPKEAEELAKDGIYCFGVEEIAEGYWYIFLNISGCYAGYERG